MARLFFALLVSVMFTGCFAPEVENDYLASDIVGTWESTDGLYEWTFNDGFKAVEHLKKSGKSVEYEYTVASNRIDVYGRGDDNRVIKGVYAYDSPRQLKILFGVGGHRPKSIRDSGPLVQEMLTLRRK